MQEIIDGLGMYKYMYPILLAWANRYGYEMISDYLVDKNVTFYYSDQVAADARGDHQYMKWNRCHVIRIRPGIEDEERTWAHELAHMIQAHNIGLPWHEVYKKQTDSNSYWDNQYEIEARDAGRMVSLAIFDNILTWNNKYNARFGAKVSEENYPCNKPKEKKTKKTSFCTGGWMMLEYKCRYETRLEELARKKMWRDAQRRHNQKGRR